MKGKKIGIALLCGATLVAAGLGISFMNFSSSEIAIEEENFSSAERLVSGTRYGVDVTKLVSCVGTGDGHVDHAGWTELTAGGKLSSGKYFLNQDLTITSPLTVSSGTVDFCLNGHSIVFRVDDYYKSYATIDMSGGTLNIHQCVNEGWGIANDVFGCVIRMSGGTCNFYGGAIYSGEGISSEYKGTNGGGVCMSGGEFHMHGGYIRNNFGASGGGVYMEKGHFYMDGGAIFGNETSGNGGGVYVGPSANFQIGGGFIVNNHSNNEGGAGGGVYVSENANFTVAGSPKIFDNVKGKNFSYDNNNADVGEQNNVYLSHRNAKIHCHPTWALTAGTRVQVTLCPDYAIGDTFTSEFSSANSATDPGDFFTIDGTSADGSHNVVRSSGGEGVYSNDAEANGEAIAYARLFSGKNYFSDTIYFEKVASAVAWAASLSASLPDMPQTQVVVENNYTSDRTLSLKTGVVGLAFQSQKTVLTFNLSGENTNCIEVGNATFTFSNYGIIDGGGKSRGIYIHNGATVTVGGTIRNCCADRGAGIYVTDPRSELIINGTISNCHATGTGIDYGGGGIYTSAGAQISPYSLNITNCSAYVGGGVYLVGSDTKFAYAENTISKISIKNCTAISTEQNGGGGVAVFGGAHFTTNMGNNTNDATQITGCTANVGGGIFASGSTVEIGYGTTISSCTATTKSTNNGGGGVAVYWGAKFTMYGGTITGNEATNSSGGGIFVASGSGVEEKCEVEIAGGSITGNTAKVHCGGIRLNSSDVTLSGYNLDLSGNTMGEADNKTDCDIFVGADCNTYVTGGFLAVNPIAISNDAGSLISTTKPVVTANGNSREEMLRALVSFRAPDPRYGAYLHNDGNIWMDTENVRVNIDGSETTYGTFDDAFNAAKVQAATITLLHDISVPKDDYSISNTKGITLDLAGHQLIMSPKDYFFLNTSVPFVLKSSGSTGSILGTSNHYVIYLFFTCRFTVCDSVQIGGTDGTQGYVEFPSPQSKILIDEANPLKETSSIAVNGNWTQGILTEGLSQLLWASDLEKVKNVFVDVTSNGHECVGIKDGEAFYGRTHSYSQETGSWDWDWSLETPEASLTAPCAYCDHTEYKTCSASAKETSLLTCTQDGVTEYSVKATMSDNTVFTDSQEKRVAATGHDWQFSAADGKITATCNHEEHDDAVDGAKEVEFSLASPASCVYGDGNDHAALLTRSSDDAQSELTASVTYSGTANDGTAYATGEFDHAGTVTASLTVQFKETTSESISISYSIGTAPLTVKVRLAQENASLVFGATTVPALDVAYSGFVKGETDRVLTGKATYSTEYDPTNPAHRGVGDYSFTKNGEDSAYNYHFIYEYSLGDETKTALSDLKFTVTALPIDVKWVYNSSYTYTTSDLGIPTASATGLYSDVFTLSVKITAHPEWGEENEFICAGEYTFKASFDPDASNADAAKNYALKEGESTEWGDTLQLTVAKATVVTPTIAQKEYQEETLIADIDASDLYEVIENKGGINVGGYNVVLKLTDKNNYTWSTSSEEQITLTFNIIITDNYWRESLTAFDRTYGEYVFYPSARPVYGSPYAVNYAYATSEEGPFNIEDMPMDVGTYWVKATVDATENYRELTAITSFKITKATATVTLTLADASIVYGTTTVPALDVVYSDFVNDESDEVLTGKATYSTTYDPTNPAHRGVGDYSFTKNGEDTAHNYNFKYVYLLGSETKGSLADLKFTVEAKRSEVKWGDTAFTYTGDPLLPTASIDPAYADDDVTLTVTPSVVPTGSGALTDGNAINVGNYLATATLDDPNYLLEESTAPFEIGKLTIDVKWNYKSSYMYSRDDLGIPTASAEGVKDDKFTLSVKIVDHPEWGEDDQFICAGEYTFKASFDPDASNADAAKNYDLKAGESTEQGDTLHLSVAEKPVDVDWTVMGSYTYTGDLIVWPSATADGGHVDFIIAMTEHSVLGAANEFKTAGNYAFAASFNEYDDHNYDFIEGATTSISVTVAQAEVGVDWKAGYENFATYDDRDFNQGNAVTNRENFAFTGLVEADRTSFDAFTPTVEGDVIKNVGTYVVTIALTDQNYTFADGKDIFLELTFTVNKATVDEHWGEGFLPQAQEYIYHEYIKAHNHTLTLDTESENFPLSLKGDDRLQNIDVTYLYALGAIENIAELTQRANSEKSDACLVALDGLAVTEWTAREKMPQVNVPELYTMIFRAEDPAGNHETLYGYFTVTIHKEKLTIVLDERIDLADVVYGQVDHSQEKLRRDIMSHIASIEIESADGTLHREMSADGRPWLDVFTEEIGAFKFYFRTSPDRTDGTRIDTDSGAYLPVGPTYYLHIEYFYGDEVDEEQDYITFEWTYNGESARPSFRVIPATLTFKLAPSSAVYSGSPHRSIEAVFQGLVGEESLEKDVDYTLTFALAENSKGELEDGLPLNAGKYIATLRLSDTKKAANYVIKDGADTQEYAITADRLIVTGIKVSVKAGSLTYGDSLEFDCSEVRFFDESGKEITREFLQERGIELVVNASGCFSKYNTGDMPIVLITWIELTGDTNDFELKLVGQQAFAAAEQEIEKAALTVRVRADGSVSYEGFVNGDDESVLGGKLVVENGQASGLTSGNYAISYIVERAPESEAETSSGWFYPTLGAFAALAAAAAAATVLFIKKRRM